MGAMPTVVETSGELSEVALYESTLTANGAEYEAMFRFPQDPFEFEPDLQVALEMLGWFYQHLTPQREYRNHANWWKFRHRQ